MLCISRIPRPPSRRGLHAVFQSTRATPRASPCQAPRQKNWHILEVSLFRMVLGSRRMDRKKVGMAERIALISTKWPPLDNMRAFHPSSCCSTFSTTGCIETRSVDSGMPKYLMGRDSLGMARIAEYHTASSSGISKVTSVDLSRLRQKFEKFEKMSSIADTFSAAFEVPWSRNIVSSAYWRSRIPC